MCLSLSCHSIVIVVHLTFSQTILLLCMCYCEQDPGIQFYGGKLFTSVRDMADDVFCSLPPPVASIVQPSWARSSYDVGSTPTPAPAITSMRTYHDASAPCFPAFCKVTMADGSLRRVDEVRKGDWVTVPDVSGAGVGGVAPVECVVKTFTVNGHMHLVSLPGGLVVTPWHPVYIDGKWQFPMDLCESAACVPCNAVFSFVLGPPSNAGVARGAAMLIDEVRCITLAHGLPGVDPVASHEFYGTERVVRDLRAVSERGYADGTVLLVEGCVLKDPSTGRACGFSTNMSRQTDPQEWSRGGEGSDKWTEGCVLIAAEV